MLNHPISNIMLMHFDGNLYENILLIKGRGGHSFREISRST